MNGEKREMLKYAGDLSQLFFVKDYVFHGGKQDGIRAFDVNNGSGLDFTVVADRGLDILGLRFRGVNFAYLSKAGLTSPFFSDTSTDGFLRNFFAGFLTTCGLSNIGLASREGDTEYGMHGRLSRIPAEEVYGRIDYSTGSPVARIGGVLKESKLFGENLSMTREISCGIGKNVLVIEDEVENLGFRKEPVFLLYHFNFGHPLLDGDSTIILDPLSTEPRTDVARKGLATWKELHGPVPGYREQVFYHEMPADAAGLASVGLVNRRLEMGVLMKYSVKELNTLVQWKQLGEGEYVLGLEPGNSRLSGRMNEIQEGRVEYLEPGETKKVRIELHVVSGEAGLSAVL